MPVFHWCHCSGFLDSLDVFSPPVSAYAKAGMHALTTGHCNAAGASTRCLQ